MTIESYQFGNITIDGETYTSDVIIYPDRVDSSWWRKQGHRLSIEDLKGIMEAEPEVLVVGMGSPGLMRVPPETRDYIEARGIELVVEPTDKAWKTYNRLKDSRKVVAALHLTC
ncbi:MAG: hypothetical protein DRQ02_07170 [Candidatus Latescibacterota bacterium]|nr:MAG: hypothetical protein DRQ02_07170 [Candidatus Latescibacterota bacterium]